MNISQVRANGYVPMDLPGDDRSRQTQINSLKYVEHLGSVTSTDVSDWPIEVFRSKATGKVYAERQKINELFFEFKERKAKDPKASPIKPEKAMELENSLNEILAERLRDQEYRLGEYRLQVERRSQALLTAQRDLLFCHNQIRLLREAKKISWGLEKTINDIHAIGFWTIDEKDPALAFISKPVTITYLNKEQRRHNVVHLGRLKLIIQVKDDGLLWPQIIKHDGAEHDHSATHPHVASDGSICFGGISARASKAMAKRDIFDLCECARQVVNDYNEGDAYHNIYEFEEATAEDDEPEDDREPDEDYEEEDDGSEET